ncbi:hypothetical protein [Jiella sp. M17.18]|uniref:hypothetical protein n=1 Tax=Jiella sp. M17.18 TaxID=3234247 RepID=UPI0034DE8FA6
MMILDPRPLRVSLSGTMCGNRIAWTASHDPRHRGRTIAGGACTQLDHGELILSTIEVMAQNNLSADASFP